jgi:hypothetical protein
LFQNTILVHADKIVGDVLLECQFGWFLLSHLPPHA